MELPDVIGATGPWTTLVVKKPWKLSAYFCEGEGEGEERAGRSL